MIGMEWVFLSIMSSFYSWLCDVAVCDDDDDVMVAIKNVLSLDAFCYFQ